ncbi:ABC transporter ATP-binding protein [Acinetobacter sp.]|uniref:ABC transporter ATP-binding protein n=1 Tax=Acinetobacter sp. TaxID=472 RepID=UPI003BB17415
MPDIPLLQFRQLTKHFKNKILFENLDYQLSSCGLYTLVGANGAGKSTLLAMIAGMEPLSSGEIRVNGYSSRQKRHIAAELAFVPDHTMAYPFITGREFLDFIASVRHLTPHSYSELIDDFGLNSFLDIQFQAMSFGTAKKISLISALMADVPILILDEPSHGLDAKSLQILKEKLNEAAKNKMVLMTCHDLNMQQQMSTIFIDIAEFSLCWV